MPDPANASVAITASHERRNVFLAPDAACDVSTRGDARRDVELISPADQAGAPFEAGERDPGGRANRLGHRHRRGRPTALVRRSAAALATAAFTAALLAFPLAQPHHPVPRAGDVARPATVAAASREPLDALPRPPVPATIAKPRHSPTPDARSRRRATKPAAERRTARRRARTRARPGSTSPGAPPVQSPSPTPSPALAPIRAAPRAPALPDPVPADAPPEFM
jgi:hypothetical protein